MLLCRIYYFDYIRVLIKFFFLIKASLFYNVLQLRSSATIIFKAHQARAPRSGLATGGSTVPDSSQLTSTRVKGEEPDVVTVGCHCCPGLVLRASCWFSMFPPLAFLQIDRSWLKYVICLFQGQRNTDGFTRYLFKYLNMFCIPVLTIQIMLFVALKKSASTVMYLLLQK